jgi:hypothetical protein
MNGTSNSVTCPGSGEALVPLKRFVDVKNQSPAIRAATKSVRKLCRCELHVDTCSTVVAVERPGLFVTNQHILDYIKSSQDESECGGKLVAQLADGSVRTVHLKIIREGKFDRAKADSPGHDNHMDVALLQIDELKDVPPLKFATQDARLGQKVYNIGFPAGPLQLLHIEYKDPTPFVSDGAVTSMNENNVTGNFIGMQGMSGGAVVNEKGEYVGPFWGHERASPYEEFKVVNVLKGEIHKLPKRARPEESYFIPKSHVESFLKGTLK